MLHAMNYASGRPLFPVMGRNSFSVQGCCPVYHKSLNPSPVVLESTPDKDPQETVNPVTPWQPVKTVVTDGATGPMGATGCTGPRGPRGRDGKPAPPFRLHARKTNAGGTVLYFDPETRQIFTVEE